MAQGFSLEPTQLPARSGRGRKSPYRDLLEDALQKFTEDKKIEGFKVNLPEGVKTASAYTGLKNQLKKSEFAGKLGVSSINGSVYITRAKRK
jgi:hypothetical protein